MVNHVHSEEEAFLLYKVLIILEPSNPESLSFLFVQMMSVSPELPHRHWHGGCNSLSHDF